MRFKLPPGTGLCAQDFNDVADAMKKEIERLELVEVDLLQRVAAANVAAKILDQQERLDHDKLGALKASFSKDMHDSEVLLATAREEIACLRRDLSDLAIARRTARTSMHCLREIVAKGLICSWAQHSDGTVSVNYFPFTAEGRALLEEETKRANRNGERADEAERMYKHELDLHMLVQTVNQKQSGRILELEAENKRLKEINARSPAMSRVAEAISAPVPPLNGWTVARLAERMMNNVIQRMPAGGPLPPAMYEVMADAILASHGVAR